MATSATIYNDSVTNVYFYRRNNSGAWTADSSNPVAKHSSSGGASSGSESFNSSYSAIAMSSVELDISDVDDDTLFNEGIYVDPDKNSNSPYSDTNGLIYSNASNTGNEAGRSGGQYAGTLFARSYNCIASDRQQVEFTKEYKDDVTPDMIFEHHKMTKQEDTFYVSVGGLCHIKPPPLRSIFAGTAAIRGQSHDPNSAGFYKITLGDTVVNSS